jgi:SnoaL-like protein
MRESTDVRDGMLKFYERVSANDVASFAQLVSKSDAILIIGTEAGEFVRERDRLEFGFRTEGYGLTAGPNPVGYEEGTLGWVVDEPVLHYPDGTDVQTRVTAVLHKEDGAWKLVHSHFSVGVPDDEVAELQKRWGTQP